MIYDAEQEQDAFLKVYHGKHPGTFLWLFLHILFETSQKPEENSAEVFETWEDMPKVPTLFDVRPIGPPVPLSFACWISLSVLDSGQPSEPNAVLEHLFHHFWCVGKEI